LFLLPAWRWEIVALAAEFILKFVGCSCISKTPSNFIAVASLNPVTMATHNPDLSVLLLYYVELSAKAVFRCGHDNAVREIPFNDLGGEPLPEQGQSILSVQSMPRSQPSALQYFPQSWCVWHHNSTM
jgi:hypothetical protein